jgi:hypothetical protein
MHIFEQPGIAREQVVEIINLLSALRAGAGDRMEP